jgi:hypothetical protein
MGHYNRMLYLAAAEGETVARVRLRMLEEMVRPCGPPPARGKKGDWPQPDPAQA